MLEFLSSNKTWIILGLVIISFSVIVLLKSFVRVLHKTSITISSEHFKTTIGSQNYSAGEIDELIVSLEKITYSGSGSVISQAGRTVEVIGQKKELHGLETHLPNSSTNSAGGDK